MVTFVGGRHNTALLALLAAALPLNEGHEFIEADLPPLPPPLPPQRELRGLEVPTLDSYPIPQRGCTRVGCGCMDPRPLRAQEVPRAPLTESEQKVQKRQAKREQKKALRKEAKRLRKQGR